MKELYKRIFISIILLILGCVIYFLFDKEIVSKTTQITKLLRNFLPDMLWCLSFYCISIYFSKKITNKYLIITSIYVFVISLLFEYLQHIKIINGVFDIYDIFIYIFSIVIANTFEIKLGGKL